MGVMENFIRLLKNDYKVGVESQSQTPVAYIDPNRYNFGAIERILTDGKGVYKGVQDLNNDEKDTLGDMVAQQLDEQYGGISQKLSRDERAELLISSIARGPFADRSLKEKSNVCVINMPYGNMVHRDQILRTFDILGKDDNPEHFRTLPGSNAIWKELIGEHEGEHCNQESPDIKDPEIAAKVLDGEARADIEAIKKIRAAGHDDVARAFIDIRSLTALDDPTHATGIFLDREGYEGATQQHISAALSLKAEMNQAVVSRLNITFDKAEELRHQDPQKYAKTVREALEDGDIPKPHKLGEKDVRDKMATKMGLSVEEFELLEPNKIKDIEKAYQELKAENGLVAPINPHIKEYMTQYVGAVSRIYVEDTTPKASLEVKVEQKAENQPAVIDKAAAEQQEREQEAENNAWRLTDEAVAKELKISQDDVDELGEKDPAKYIETIEKLLKAGKISSTVRTDMNNDERDALIAQKMGLSDDGLKQMYEKDNILYNTVYERLDRANMFKKDQENPFVYKAIEKNLENLREDLKNKTQENEEAPSEPETTPATAPEANKVSLNTTPQVDLRSGERGAMTICGKSACDYFAQQANPALASKDEPAVSAQKLAEKRPTVAQSPMALA